MRERKPPQKNWKVHLENIYQPDREEKIKKAYQIALPERVSKQAPKLKEEVREYEPEYRHLRQSIQ